MANTVLILHGWSDTQESFVGLKRILCRQGHAFESIYLGSYRSMEDSTTFDHVADGFQARVEELLGAGKLTRDPNQPHDDPPRLAPFSVDVVAHSTGGPVLRHWLTRYLKNVEGELSLCPVQRIVLLAPANFGSRLAAQGQSALAMIFKGGVSHGFQTGRHILQGLELGSPFLCDLAERDLFAPKPIYPVDPARGPFVFVFSGTSTYERLKGLVAPGATENGSDGTVRAAAASLDSIKIRADFRQPTPKIRAQRQQNRPIAFRLLPGRNHTEIVPQDDGTAHPMIDFIRRCLAVRNGAEYAALVKEFNADNDAFYERQRTDPPSDPVHRFQQFIVRVIDDMDVEVDDYQMSFHIVDDVNAKSTWVDGVPSEALRKYQQYTQRLQEKVIVHVQTHTVRKTYRTFFVDLDEKEALDRELAELPGTPFIALNIEATSPTPGVTFDTDRLHYMRLDATIDTVKGTKPASGHETGFFAPNTSTLVEIVLRPIADPSVADLQLGTNEV